MEADGVLGNEILIKLDEIGNFALIADKAKAADGGPETRARWESGGRCLCRRA